MRPLSLVALFVALSAPAFAQPLGLGAPEAAPAAESAGSSSSGVTLLGDSVSVGIGGSGALDADTGPGQVEGQGRLDLSVGESAVTLQSPAVEIGGTTRPVLALDPDGNGRIDPAERRAAREFARTQSGPCEGLIVSTSSPEQIIAVDSAVALALVCARPDGLEPAQRAAIAGNPALMSRLVEAGYGLADVAGIVLDVQGRGTLYLTAS